MRGRATLGVGTCRHLQEVRRAMALQSSSLFDTKFVLLVNHGEAEILKDLLPEE